MVSKSMWAAFAVLLAYTPSAFAYEYAITQTDAGDFTYATELFGRGSGSSRIDYDGDGPKVTLWTILADDEEENSISVGDTMEITLRLANAQFAANIRTGDVDVRSYHNNPLTPGNEATPVIPRADRDRYVVVEKDEGGSAGTSMVTYIATAEAGWSGTDDGNTNPTAIAIEIELPPLSNLVGTTRRPVTVTVEVDAGGGSGFLSSDDADVTVASTGVGNATGMQTARSSGSGVLRLTSAAAEATGNRPSVHLVSFTPALAFAVAGGGTSNIDITSTRMMVEPTGGRNQVYLGRATVGVPTGGVKQLDGQTFSISNRQDGEGDLVVWVSGAFHAAGDQVWLDLDGDHAPDADEMLALNEGVFSGRFGLTDVAGDASSTGETEEAERRRDEGNATRNLIFRPNGTDTLRPATYTSSFYVDFDAESNADKFTQRSTLSTQYFVQEGANMVVIGDSLTRHAYAIPPLGSGDEGNVRVKCEVATECPVYIECDDTSGDSWFAAVRNPIDAYATLQLSNEDIAEHLDLGEDGWTGRLSCTVMSTRDISLQVLTRSNGALINNTFVDN